MYVGRKILGRDPTAALRDMLGTQSELCLHVEIRVGVFLYAPATYTWFIKDGGKKLAVKTIVIVVVIIEVYFW